MLVRPRDLADKMCIATGQPQIFRLLLSKRPAAKLGEILGQSCQRGGVRGGRGKLAAALRWLRSSSLCETYRARIETR